MTAQTYLVDTGPGSSSFNPNSVALFAEGNTSCTPQPDCSISYQFVGTRFTLLEAATLDTIQAWMAPGEAGSIDVRIRAEFDDFPAVNPPPLFSPDSLYSKTFAMGSRFSYGWVTFGGYGAVLAAGTYWLVFEPVDGSGFDTSMPPGAPNPLERYVFRNESSGGWQDLPANRTLGIRIAGTPFPGLAFGTGTRTVMSGTVFDLQNSYYEYDFLRGSAGDPLTPAYIFVTTGDHLHARGRLNENWLTAGAYSYQGTQTTGGARGVSFRTFQNMGNVARTLRVNALLGGTIFGATSPGMGSYSRVRAGVYVLDTDGFTATVAGSGVDAIEYLLRDGDGYDAEDLAPLFPGSVLAHEFLAPILPAGPVSLPLTLDPVTVAPGEHFTLLFYVFTGSHNVGLNFASTLEPASILFTDLGGAQVIEMVAVGEVAPPVPVTAALVLEPAATALDTKSLCTITATATTAGGQPVPDTSVVFLVTSGPNAGATGTVSTDLDGQASFSYFGLIRGTDTVQASVGAVVTSPAQVVWSGPPPVRRR
ncbi:MAG TPA: hypothetical protein VF530_04690 [Planctomycetota bacterium]